LGPDLSVLVRAWPAPLTSITEVTGLPSTIRRRGSFRLDFADGTQLKGRRFQTLERAARVSALLRELGDGFPRLIDARGDALLLEWIDGPALASLRPLPASVLVSAGDLLGTIHRFQSAQRPTDVEDTSLRRLSKLRADAQVLANAGVFDSAMAHILIDAAGAHMPEDGGCGLIHKDFCASNIVLRGETPVSIDNANLAFGPYDLDLARTWCRWPMTPDEWKYFVGGYRRHRSPESFLQHFHFWAAVVLFGSASTRIRAGSDQARIPLEQLRVFYNLVVGNADTDPSVLRWPHGAPPP